MLIFFKTVYTEALKNNHKIERYDDYWPGEAIITIKILCEYGMSYYTSIWKKFINR